MATPTPTVPAQNPDAAITDVDVRLRQYVLRRDAARRVQDWATVGHLERMIAEQVDRRLDLMRRTGGHGPFTG